MSNKKIYVSIAMPADLVEMIDADAKRETRSRANNIVRRLLEFYEEKNRAGGKGAESKETTNGHKIKTI